jgi:hypothetical protein
MSRPAPSNTDHAPAGSADVADRHRASVDAALATFLAEQMRRAANRQVSLFVAWLRESLLGGKRLSACF